MSDQPPIEAHPHLGSYVDPVGTLYEREGALLRGIHSSFASFYAALLRDATVREMLGQQIVETEIASDELAGYALTLQHRRIMPVSYCYEWPAPMLREAALLTVEIGLRLTEAKLVLKDASPWNIVFEGSRPVFVDFTSIVPQDPHLLWVAYDQFCRLFLYPLALFSVQPGRVARALLMDAITGIADRELTGLLPSGAWLRLPWLMGRVYWPRFLLTLIRRLSTDRALGQMTAHLSPGSEARRAFFGALQRDIKSMRLQSESRWSRYYNDVKIFFRPAEFNQKQTTVARILDECSPKTVVDIGCNVGGYSILATKAGARVSAFDSDEASVGMLYQLVRQESLNILPLVMDVLNPSPACGWRAMQFFSAPQRLRSEMALALALVHHLAITQRQTFERIVLALADYAEKWLLTEFVPLEDERSRELLATSQRDMSWYSLDGFVKALGQVFSRVETLPSYPEGRALILCAR